MSKHNEPKINSLLKSIGCAEVITTRTIKVSYTNESFSEEWQRSFFEYLIAEGKIKLPKGINADDFEFRPIDRVRLNFVPTTNEIIVKGDFQIKLLR